MDIVRLNYRLLKFLNEGNKPVKSGEIGEVVFTSLRTEALPLIRFRTGDIATYYEEKCSCGSISPRLGPILGRKKLLLKFKGTSVYPTEIIRVLQQYMEHRIFVLEILSDEFGHDVVKVIIDCPPDEADELKAQFKEVFRVRPEIELETTSKIQQIRWSNGARKPKIIFDKR